MFGYLTGLSQKNSSLVFQSTKCFSELWKKKKNIIIKPYTIYSGETVFSATPIKGKYGNKSDYITVMKNGCMLAEVIPSSKDANGRNTIEYNKRLSFALSLQNMGQILAISDEAINNKSIHTQIDYTLSSNIKKKVLTITKQPQDQHFDIKISEDNLNEENNKWIETNLKATVQVSEFLVFRELCRFSLPYMIGWQALASYDFAEKDSTDERL